MIIPMVMAVAMMMMGTRTFAYASNKFIGPGPACRACENLHFGNFQLSKLGSGSGSDSGCSADCRSSAKWGPVHIRVGVHRVNSVTTLPARFASKCNFLISHWGNGAKNLDGAR